MEEFTIQDKKITLYECGDKEAPVVYLNTVMGEGNSVWNACSKAGCPPFNLAAVSGLNWDHDMSPWAIPPISPRDNPCTGGADDYLKLLTEEIIPAAENGTGIRPAVRALAGYSLAGLFAVYAVCNTDVFTRVASASGSLWFPGFYEYVRSHEIKANVSRMYFSLGDKEARTKNKFLAPVRENTEKTAEYMKGRGINAVFELNPGNHYKQPDLRMAKGIAWILTESEVQNE